MAGLYSAFSAVPFFSGAFVLLQFGTELPATYFEQSFAPEFEVLSLLRMISKGRRVVLLTEQERPSPGGKAPENEREDEDGYRIESIFLIDISLRLQFKPLGYIPRKLIQSTVSPSNFSRVGGYHRIQLYHAD